MRPAFRALVGVPILLAAAAALLPSAHAQMPDCPGGWEANEEGFRCLGDSSGGGGKDLPWWADETSQAVVGLVALAGSVGAGTWAYVRVKNRRKRLTDTLMALETAFQRHKRSPKEGTAKLLRMRAAIRDFHKKGLIDDAQFLELDKRGGEYLVRLRLLELDQRFPGLSPAIHAQIRNMMADGRVTDAEVDLVERQLDAAMLPPGARDELVVTFRRWADQDAGSLAVKVAKTVPAARN